MLTVGLYPAGGPSPHVGVLADTWALGFSDVCPTRIAGMALTDGYMPDNAVFNDAQDDLRDKAFTSDGAYLFGSFGVC